jgi:co-chaperonin GroES (HSP10)
MSRKITINNLEDIKFLVKEDSLIVAAEDHQEEILPLSAAFSHYQKGTVVVLCPEKPKPIKDGETILEDANKIKVQDRILFENSNVLSLITKDMSKKYYIISKKDVLLVIK